MKEKTIATNFEPHECVIFVQTTKIGAHENKAICFTCIDFYYLSASGGCWFVVYIRFIYKCLNVCPFDYTAVAGSGKVGTVNQVNHTSWVVVVTPTDRPQSVRNRYVIEFLWCCLCCTKAY